MFVGCGIVFFNQLSGGAALGYFGGNVAFGAVTGCSPSDLLQMFVYLNLVQIIVTLLAGQLNEKYGRRAFMMEGQRIIIICLLLIAFIEVFVPALHVFTVILTFVQMVGFSLSYGPCSFVILTELMHDIWLPSLILWIFIFIHGVSIGTFVDTLGIGPLAFLYFLAQIIGLLYISGYLVETSGRSRQDVYADFRKGIFPSPVRYLQEKLKGKPQGKESDIEIELLSR